MAKSTHTGNRPKPPAKISDEALLEWERVCDELAALGKLHVASRAVLTVYVATWQAFIKALEVVAIDGPVVLLPNNWPGNSPEYRTMIEAGKLVAALAKQLGLECPPVVTKPNEAPTELSF